MSLFKTFCHSLTLNLPGIYNPNMRCPCCSGKDYATCCEPFHQKLKFPKTAEELMRSRYTAFAIPNADYLMETTSPMQRKFHDKKEIEDWAKNNHWTKLEILSSSKSKVEFKAYFTDVEGKNHIHYEKSNFKYLNQRWYYHDGIFVD